MRRRGEETDIGGYLGGVAKASLAANRPPHVSQLWCARNKRVVEGQRIISKNFMCVQIIGLEI